MSNSLDPDQVRHSDPNYQQTTLVGKGLITGYELL